MATERDASAVDIRNHFECLARTALRFVRMRRAGYYGAFRVRSDYGAWLADVFVDRVKLLPSAGSDAIVDQRIASLVNMPDAEILLTGAQVMLRRRHLCDLRLVVENPYSRENALRRALLSSSWVWGGDFVDICGHRRLVTGKEVDITLLRPDAVLHAIELKRANLKVVKQHRGELVLTSDVHDAVGQMANYLRSFDEDRDEILERYGVDVRRAHGTVVIGHPMFQPDVAEHLTNEAIRTYNSHLSRIDVMTYKQLLDGADRSLDLAERGSIPARPRSPV